MQRFHFPSILRIALVVFLITSVVLADKARQAKKLESAKLGSTINVHRFGTTLLCGQPSREDLSQAKKQGIQVILTLRQEGEIDWNEQQWVRNLGMEFHQVAFREPDSLTDEIFETARKILVDSKKKPVLLHCGSANRVGAIWAAYRALDEGLSLQAAIEEAKTVGLRSPAYEKKTIDYIRRQKQ